MNSDREPLTLTIRVDGADEIVAAVYRLAELLPELLVALSGSGSAKPIPYTLNLTKAGEALGVSAATVSNLIRSGQLASVDVGGTVKVTRDTLIAYVQSLPTRTPPPRQPQPPQLARALANRRGGATRTPAARDAPVTRTRRMLGPRGASVTRASLPVSVLVQREHTAFAYKNAKGQTYYLHHKTVTLQNGRKQSIYWFKRDISDEAAGGLPPGARVVENQRTGLPHLKLR